MEGTEWESQGTERRSDASGFFEALEAFAIAHMRDRRTWDKRAVYRVLVRIAGRATRVVRVYYYEGKPMAVTEPTQKYTIGR